MLTITCKKCKEEKDSGEFNKDSSRKNGYAAYCKDCRSEINNEFYKNNRKSPIYPNYKYINNPEKYLEEYERMINKDKYNKEYKQQPENKLRLQKMNNIKAALKKGTKSEILGCDGDQARTELETKLGFSIDWPNFTRDFQLDYIKPLSSFNLTNPIEISQAFNIQNLILKKRKFRLDL